jgi:hypothetical protein
MALQMWRYGPDQFGTAFVATPHQRDRWARLWACAPGEAAAPCLLSLRLAAHVR